jgi:hypothetical protein
VKLNSTSFRIFEKEEEIGSTICCSPEGSSQMLEIENAKICKISTLKAAVPLFYQILILFLLFFYLVEINERKFLLPMHFRSVKSFYV